MSGYFYWLWIWIVRTTQWLSVSAHNVKEQFQTRQSVHFESLERRNLMAVNSSLVGSVLDINFGADNDQANVAVVGNQLRITSAGIETNFSLSSFQSIDVDSVTGKDQSISFGGTIELVGSIDVDGINAVSFATGNYHVGSATVVSPGSIEFNAFNLEATGELSIHAQKTLTSTQTGLLGFLGVVSKADTSVKIVDSNLSGAKIDVLAHTELSATAAGDSAEDTNRDFARIKTVGNASITVTGTSNLQSRGRLSLIAESIQTIDATASALDSGGSTSRDAALALTNITSNATIQLTDRSILTSIDDANIDARNIVTVTTTADGSLAGGSGKGGTVALAEFTGLTTVLVGDSSSINSANLKINAVSTANLTTKSKSTVGGASNNDQSTKDDLADSNNGANTSDGGLGLVGAYARLKSNQTTQVTIGGNVSLTTRGNIDINSDKSTNSTTTADGTTTNNNGDASNGVGVAIAIDRDQSTNRVSLSGTPTIRAAQLNVSAISVAGDNHTTTATSGVGVGNVGFAGGFASTKLVTTTQALIANGTTLNASASAVSLTADSKPRIVTEAKPTGTTSLTAKKGIGASVARSKLLNNTMAFIGDAAQVTNATSLSITANAVDNVTTNAVTGAEGGSAATPGVAAAVVDSNVGATIGTGSAMVIAGAVSLQANHGGDINTTVAGNVLTEKVALGGSFVLNDVDIDSTASINRSLTATGDVTSIATASGNLNGDAKASVKGTGESTKTSDQQAAEQKLAAGSDKDSPSADAKGKVAAGAAVALNLVDVHVKSVVSREAAVRSTGKVSLGSSNSVDASAKADASAVGSGTTTGGSTTGGTDKGIAIAVAINRVKTSGEVLLGDKTAIDGTNGLTIDSNTTVGSDTQHLFAAETISGAGGRKTGFAGSFALNKVDNLSSSNIAGVAINIGVGEMKILATNTATNTAKASPSISATGDERGVGTSFAMNIAENDTLAVVSGTAQIISAREAGTATRSSVLAVSNQTALTNAIGGSGSETTPGQKALTPVFAIQAINNLTDAQLAAATTTLGGGIQVKADLTAINTINAEGTAVATNAARGLVLALDLGENQTHATTASQLATGSESATLANAKVTQTLTSKASATGGDAKAITGGTNKETADAKQVALSAGAKDNGQNSPDQKTQTGPVTFAAALAIGLSKTITTAILGNGAVINATGSVAVSATSQETSSVKSDANALTLAAAQDTANTNQQTADASGRGSGVAVAVNVNTLDTLATIGTGTDVRSQGLSITSSTPARGKHTFVAQATSGAGSGEVGNAGSLAINVVRNTSDARIKPSTIDAGNGVLEVSATNNSDSNNTSAPSVSGSKRGRGAAFAINVAHNTTHAEIEDNVLVRRAGTTTGTGAGNVIVRASSSNNTTTNAKGGAGSEDAVGNSAVTGIFGLTRAVNTTTARLSGSDVGRSHAAGGVTVEAIHSGATTTDAEGSSRAEQTTVGIVFGLDFVDDNVNAEIANNWDVEGNVNVKSTNNATVTSSAKASARGGEADKKSDNGLGKGDVDIKTSESKNLLSDTDGQQIDKETPSAKTPDKSMAFAGGLVVNSATVTSVAKIADRADVKAVGSVTIGSASQAIVTSKSDASAVVIPPDENNQTQTSTGSGSTTPLKPDPSQTGVGVAIDINAADVRTEATVGGNAKIKAAFLTLDAGTAADGNSDHQFRGDAISGTGVDKVGFAGSLTINVVKNDSLARISNSSEINLIGTTDPDLVASSKDLTVISRNNTSSIATAVASVAGSPKTGIGPAIVVNVSENSSNAEITGATFVSHVDDLTVNALGFYLAHTIASSGSTSRATLQGEGGTAISPALAVSMVNNTTNASAGKSTQGISVDVDGKLQIGATHMSQTTGDAEALVNASGKEAIGTPVAINVAKEKTNAIADGTFHVGASADIKATSDIQTNGNASASVMGARFGQEGAANLKDRAQQWGNGFRREPGEPREKILDRLGTQLAVAGDKINQLGTAAIETTGVAASGVANVVLSDTLAAVDGTLIAVGAVNIIAESDRDVTANASSIVASPTFQDGTGAALAINIAEQSILARAQSDNALSGDQISIRAGTIGTDTHVIKARALAGAGAKQDGKAGSIGINIVIDKIRASVGESPIENAVLTMDVTAPKGLTAESKSNLEVQNIAGAAGVGFQSEGFGGALAINGLGVTTESITGETTTITAGRNVNVLATSNIAPTKGDVFGDPIVLAAGGSAAGDQSRAGAAAVNLIGEHTHARLGVNNHITANQEVGPRGVTIPGNVNVIAASTTELRTGAGAVALSTKLGQGVGVALNLINKDIDVIVGNGSVVNVQRDLKVLAKSSEDFFSIAAAPTLGGSSVKPSFGGAMQITSQVTEVRAIVDAGANVTTSGNVLVESNHTVDADVITGALAGGVNNTVAGSLSILSLLDRSEAEIGAGANVSVSGTQGLTVQAKSDENIRPIAFGGTGAGDNASAGSATLNRIHETSLAHIGENATLTARNLTAPGVTRPSILVHAEDNTILNSVTGSAAFSGGQAIGAALDAIKVEKQTRAFVSGGVHMDADKNISVTANSSEDILSVSAAGGASGGTSVMGALSGFSLDVTTQAILGDSPLDSLPPTVPAVIHAVGSIVVTSDDKSEVDFIDGGVGVSGANVVGGAASIAVIHKVIEALIAPTAQASADALPTIDPVSVNNGQFNITFPNTNFDVGRVKPPTFPSRDSDGDGINDLNDSSFFHPRVVTAQTENRRGVVVTATNRDDVAATVAGVGVGGGAGGFAISIPAALLRVETNAKIGDNAQINVGNQGVAGNSQSVLVAAASDYSHLGLTGALTATSGVGIAPAANIESTHINTEASIGANARVVAKQDVAVQATATEDSLLLTASGSASGAGGGNGSVGVFALDNKTFAFIGGGADVDAGGNVVVSASDVTDLDAITGAAALGGGAGVSISLGVNVIHKDTQAFIANSASVDAKANSTSVSVLNDVGSASLSTTMTRGVVVQAYSKESLLNIAAAGAAAGGFAGAGSINVNVIDSDTSAYIGDSAQINLDSAGVNPLQSVQVLAGNEVDARSIAGGLAMGSAALAGTADIGVVRNDTTTFVGTNAVVHAKDDIVVHSLVRENVDSLGVSGAVSATGTFAAAVTVWALGTTFDPTYSDDSNTTNSLKNGSSSVDQQAASNAANSGTILSSGLSNFSGVNTSTPVNNPTPAQQIADILRTGKIALANEGQSSANITTDLFNSGDATGTVAEVRAGVKLLAGDDVNVKATADVELNSFAGSVSVAAAGAVGASITVERTHLKTDTLMAGMIENADSVTVRSSFNNDTVGKSFSGQGAIGGALGAAVTSIKDESSTTSRVDGAANAIAGIQKASAVLVDAHSVTNLTSTAGQGALAVGGALGVTVSKSVANGSTAALVGDHVQIGQQASSTVGSLTVNSIAITKANADAKALSAGVGLGSTLNFANAEITPTNDVSLGSRESSADSQIKVAGNVSVTANSISDANSRMFGVQLALGAALGFGRAQSTVAPEVEAAIGRDTSVNAGGDIAVLAQQNKPTVLTLPGGATFVTEHGAIASAESGAAAAIAGNTARAFTDSVAVVDAIAYDGASITAVNKVTFETDSNNRADSRGGSFTLGFGGAGGVQADATVAGIASAQLRNNSRVNAASLDIHSVSVDRAISEGVAATGGIVSGNATTVSADIRQGSRGTQIFPSTVPSPNSSVSVTGSSINVTGDATIVADQQADADAFAKGIAVGALFTAGMSSASVTVTPEQAAKIGNGTSIVAGGNVRVEAHFGDGSAPSVTANKIAEAEAIKLDDISVAFAKGSGGALIGAVGSEASSIYKPQTASDVGSAVTINAFNVTIRSEEDSATAAVARNLSVGLIALGSADATVNMKNTLSATVIGAVEVPRTNINATNTFTLRVDSAQDGDAFSNSRAGALIPVGTANTTILGDYDLKASVGHDVDIKAGNTLRIESQVDDANFGTQQTNDPQDPTERFGANANADTGGLEANSFATALTRLGTSTIPAQSLASVGSFTSLTAPNVFIQSDVTDIHVQSDANARSAGAAVIAKSSATGEVHSDTNVNLSSDAIVDATSVTIESLNGTSSSGIRSNVDSTSKKAGVFGNPSALGIARMDTSSNVNAFDRSKIITRNLLVRADTLVTQFDVTTEENGIGRPGSGGVTSTFVRDRDIIWNADVVLKGAASPTLIVEAGPTPGSAVVTTAIGVTIQDSDATGPFDTGTIGNVAVPTIIVNPISNIAAFGNVLFEILRRSGASDPATISGSLGTFTVNRAFDDVLIENRSSKPLQINAINVIHAGTPNVDINVPNSGLFDFDVFQNYSDTHINIDNNFRNATSSVTLNGVINNPVGETTVDSSGAISRTGTGKIVTNVANLNAAGGNIGSSANTAQRIPIEIVVSSGRQEDLNVKASGSVSLDLIARLRKASNGQTFAINASDIVAESSAANILLHTSVQEIAPPTSFPLLRVNEVQENDITFVTAHFESVEEFPLPDLGVLGTSSTPVASTWNFDLVKGSSLVVNLDPTQIIGALLNLSSNTDVGGGSIDVSTNGDITLSETTGAMRIGAVTTTRGSVTLNSNNSIVVSPIDAAADVVGTIVNLNAATSIGAAGATIDVDSTSRFNASATGDIFVVETAGNMNLGLVGASNGNVTLTAAAGSIFDAASDPDADVVGNSLTLAATNAGATIGTTTDALELNSAVGAVGTVRASASGSVTLSETSGSMTVAEARSTTGNIRIDVPDTAGTGSNLILSAAEVIAPLGAVQLNVGDDFTSSTGSVVQGTVVGVVIDFGNADPGVGSTANIAGTFTGRPITFSSGSDADTFTLAQTVLQGPTLINAGIGSDTINVDRIAPLTTLLNGVRDRLTLNIGEGTNQVNATATTTGNYIADITGAVRGSGFSSFAMNGTIGNDAIILNANQIAVVHAGSPTTSELFNFNNSIDQVTVLGNDGNDSLGIDLAGGNLSFINGVSIVGGAGTDAVQIAGSASADTFEVDATSGTSGIVRTQVAGGPFSKPIDFASTEQLSINGLNSTTNPGDTLRILDSVSVIPSIPAGNINTPLPVTYTNIEQVLIGANPIAKNDAVSTAEDIALTFNPFANDEGLTELPVSVVLVQPAFGTVVYNNNGTPNDVSDDRFVFTPPVNFSGTTTFQYTVRDANNEASTATVSVSVTPVADAPIITAANASGSEGVPIRLALTSRLFDTDGSETLDVRLLNVPAIGSFVNATNQPIGSNLGSGSWRFAASDLANLFLLTRDNGSVGLTLQATATETSTGTSATSTTNFTVQVGNTAPTATIMSAPATGAPNQPVTVTMAATDPSSVDQSSGFRYQVNWGDGSAIQIVQGTPGVGPTLDHVYTQSGLFTISVVATDKDGGSGLPATHRIRISLTGVRNDPLNPGKTMLIVEGTNGNDDINIVKRVKGNNALLDLYLNDVIEASYAIPTSRIVVYGRDGNDSINIAENVDVASWLFGGDGLDSLVSSDGNSILIGGNGIDSLRGRSGDDILIGGKNNDFFFGGSGDNILDAGYSIFDEDEVALMAIYREWTSNNSMKNRIEHLRGDSAGGLNGAILLKGDGAGATTFDDDAIDLMLNDFSHDWVLANSDAGQRDLFSRAKYLEELGPISGEGEAFMSAIDSAFSAIGTADESQSVHQKFFLDVDGDDDITPLDVLVLINRLNGEKSNDDGQSNNLYDVDIDGGTTPLDALQVINFLNSRHSTDGEGEKSGSTHLVKASMEVQPEVTNVSPFDPSSIEVTTGKRKRPY